MKGTILEFSIQENTGLISGADGERYSFPGVEWKGDAAPIAGEVVDFSTEGANALGVFRQLSSDKPLAAPENPPPSGLAIASLICGIAGFVVQPLAIVAVICGHIALSNIRSAQPPGSVGGHGMAVAGLMLGYIIIVLFVIILLLGISAMSAMM